MSYVEDPLRCCRAQSTPVYIKKCHCKYICVVVYSVDLENGTTKHVIKFACLNCKGDIDTIYKTNIKITKNQPITIHQFLHISNVHLLFIIDGHLKPAILSEILVLFFLLICHGEITLSLQLKLPKSWVWCSDLVNISFPLHLCVATTISFYQVQITQRWRTYAGSCDSSGASLTIACVRLSRYECIIITQTISIQIINIEYSSIYNYSFSHVYIYILV